MKEEQAYDRLMRTLRDLQERLEDGVRPMAEKVVQTEIERLRGLSEQQTSVLKDCLARIDQSLLNCRVQMDDYRQTRSDLVALNERLANLGAEPVAIPDHFPSENLGDLLLARLEELRAKDKI